MFRERGKRDEGVRNDFQSQRAIEGENHDNFKENVSTYR